MSVTLNNKFWIREFNCSCNFVDGQCWRPLKYSKPLLCAHKSIDNIEDFLELPNYDYELENVENYLDNYYFYNEIIFYFWIILGILFTILFVQAIYLNNIFNSICFYCKFSVDLFVYVMFLQKTRNSWRQW
ncbi:unnamed protein product [Meloidogyne enterolobii]|uniref:Uncharacterized protein n=1 Tax=Meloidogyne enterolobii TaxID=390850 RepID=A0ACB0ZFI9_MELEN